MTQRELIEIIREIKELLQMDINNSSSKHRLDNATVELLKTLLKRCLELSIL